MSRLQICAVAMLLIISVSCGRTSSSAGGASNAPSIDASPSPSITASTSKTGTSYATSNAASSCLPPPSTAAQSPFKNGDGGVQLTKADLSNFLPAGVLGAGFHNNYQVVTITSPATIPGRTVALHLWLDSPGRNRIGVKYIRTATVSVSLIASGKAPCNTTWYPATVAYTLSQPLLGDDTPSSKAVGSFNVTVDKIGTGGGTFDAATTTVLPAGVDIDSCTQQSVGVLPDIHDNGASTVSAADSGNSINPNSTSAAVASIDVAKFPYFFYRMATKTPCAGGMHCSDRYTVSGALSDDPNLCDKIQTSATGPVLPIATRYIEVSLDNDEQTLTTLALGVSTADHGTGPLAAPTKLNLPEIGTFQYTGSYKVNVLDPNTIEFLSYDFTFDLNGQPLTRSSTGPFTNQVCPKFE